MDCVAARQWGDGESGDDTYSNPNANRPSYSYTNPVNHTNTDPNADPNADSYTDTVSIPFSDTVSIASTYNTHPDTSAHAPAYSATVSVSVSIASTSMRIVCVLKSGGDYQPSHVNALVHMCRRWFRGHPFICLTDAPSFVECKTEPLRHGLAGWWSKMELFDAFREGDTLYLDLDTIIRGSTASFLESLAAAGEFAILRDFFRGRVDGLAMGSGMMFWRGDQSWIWEAFQKRGIGKLRGDQDFLELIFRESGEKASYFQDFTSEIASFKAHIQGQKTPPRAPIVCFHGQPRPWEQNVVPYPGMLKFDTTQPCVVVGNGPSILGRKMGVVIDAFPHIVRINAYKTQGFEVDVGRRVTLHSTHGKAGGISSEPSPANVLWVHGHPTFTAANNWYVPRSFFWEQVAGWTTNNHILPSTGMVTVAWLLQQGVPVVHLAGFDHFSKIQRGEHHYWHTHAMTKPAEHDGDRELARFEEWRVDGRVKYL